MSDDNLTWQEVCRELLRLDAEGVEEPWREFQMRHELWHLSGWIEADNAVVPRAINPDWQVRLKPRTVRVTTHNGEVLELPEPWWDVPDDCLYFFVRSFKGVGRDTRTVGFPVCDGRVFSGNAFRTESDAKAWADAMPKIRGAK